MIRSMLVEKEDMDYFSKLIYESIQLPVLYVNEELEVITNSPATFLTNPIHPSIHEQFDFTNDPSNIPVLRTTNFLENFISIKVEINQQYHGTWILGPSIYTTMRDETIVGLLNDFQVKSEKDAVWNYYRSLPVMNKIALLHAGLLVTYLLTSKRLSVTDVIQKNSTIEIDPQRKTHSDLLVSKSRQETSFHISYESERATFECVKDGRKEDLLERFNFSKRDEKVGVLSKKSHLRSEKNLAIACITLATRYAIDGGLQPEIAYTMSDLYIQAIEDRKDIESVHRFIEEALYDFTDRVCKVKHHQYSKPINVCLSYIFKNLYEEITLGQLAKAANMHQNYLSALFKKEVGITVSEYVLIQKVEEAKKLLSHSNHSLSEIFTWLNFHDQGHFTKVFKKYTGTTPKKYRMG